MKISSEITQQRVSLEFMYIMREYAPAIYITILVLGLHNWFALKKFLTAS